MKFGANRTQAFLLSLTHTANQLSQVSYQLAHQNVSQRMDYKRFWIMSQFHQILDSATQIVKAN